MNSTAQQGATLVELIVSIVILSITSVGVMMVITNATLSSANPMIRAQATAIAQAYMEEILSKAYPDAADSGTAEAGETRAVYDDITDYNGLSDHTGARDQQGNLIAGLEGYNIKVDVTDATVNGSNGKRIHVSVGYDADATFDVPLTAYRFD